MERGIGDKNILDKFVEDGKDVDEMDIKGFSNRRSDTPKYVRKFEKNHIPHNQTYSWIYPSIQYPNLALGGDLCLYSYTTNEANGDRRPIEEDCLRVERLGGYFRALYWLVEQ